MEIVNAVIKDENLKDEKETVYLAEDLKEINRLIREVLSKIELPISRDASSTKPYQAEDNTGFSQPYLNVSVELKYKEESGDEQ